MLAKTLRAAFWIVLLGVALLVPLYDLHHDDCAIWDWRYWRSRGLPTQCDMEGWCGRTGRWWFDSSVVWGGVVACGWAFRRFKRSPQE